MLRRLSRMCQAEKVSVSVVAGSSTRQWVYDAGAISHGVTASNLVLARILTDTLISRSPHCVLGARYDGNVNLFYVVMTGSGKPRASMVFPGTNSISSSRFAGERRKVFGTRNPATSNASSAAVYTGIEASRPSHGQLFHNGETAVGKFDSINPAPPIFCEEVVLSDGFASRFLQFATANGSAGSASALRNASIRRHAPWINRKSTACAAVAWRIESFIDLMALDLSSP